MNAFVVLLWVVLLVGVRSNAFVDVASVMLSILISIEDQPEHQFKAHHDYRR